MPLRLKEKSETYFAFSVATEKGIGPRGFGHLITQLYGAGIKLRGLSTFVTGRRTQVFCLPDDVDVFRAFAKKRKLRIRQKSVLIYVGDTRAVLGTLNKWAVSGELPSAFNFSGRGEGFVYRERFTGPS